MKRTLFAAVAVALLGAGGAAGFWLGQNRPELGAAAARPSDPQAPGSSDAGGAQGEKKLLYYRNPMGLPDTSPVPKKDWMGMDYIPVYEGEDQAEDGAIAVSPARVQKLGVRTEPVSVRPLTRTVRAAGTVQLDERRLTIVTTKFDGYIEKLHVNATGQDVRRGQPLLEVYSPEVVVAEQEAIVAFRSAQDLAGAGAESRGLANRLIESALSKLRNWDVPSGEIERLKREGVASRRITLRAPADGVVLEKPSLEGMRFTAGEPLFKMGDLSTVWVIADVFEQDLGAVQPGQTAQVTVSAFPGRVFEGRIDFIYPTLARETRSARVRIVLPNKDRSLRADMYATVEVMGGVDAEPKLAVPESAVLNNGTRQAVLVERAEGRFEPREIRIGAKADGYYEVLEGLQPDERVVIGGNFLIDAESNLRAALRAFAEPDEKKP